MDVPELIIAMQEVKNEHPSLELSDILRMYHISETQQQVAATIELSKQICRLVHK